MIDLDSIQKRLARVWGKWPTAGVAAPNADDHGPKAWAAHGPVRFHATGQGRARQWVQAQADAEFMRNAPSDIAALLAEVDRLRGEAELLRTGRDVSRAYADRLEAEIVELREDRAAVIKWLREEAEAAAQTYTVQAGEWAKRIDNMADAIERGEHRKENE